MRLLPHRLFIALALVIATPALAQQALVGRISLVEGHVNFHPLGNTGGWVAEVNDPAVAGSVIETDAKSRAEIRVGPDAIDLAPGTIIEFARLDEHGLDLVLRQGRVGVHLRQVGKSGDTEIDTPRGAVWLAHPGNYDIDAANGQPPLHVQAFEGRAHFVGGGADVSLEPGQEATLTVEKDRLAASTATAHSDPFAQWSQARGAADGAHPALAYLSPAMTGYDTLDQTGSWEGGVWYPRALPADWTPYRFGRWRWIAPWGWTWIDGEPWGFAPSHYGRWSAIGHRWGWVPGKYAEQPLYAPALVAFLGTPGVGLSFADASGPGIGWFPLAPGEVYWPGYSADLEYIRRLNAPNVGDVAAIRLGNNGELPREVFDQRFADREFASVVPRAVFAGGGAVAASLVSLPEQRLLDAPVIVGSPQIQLAAAVTKPIPPAAKPAPAPAAKEVAILRGAHSHPGAHAAARPVLAAAAHLRAPAVVAAAHARPAATPAVLRGRPVHPVHNAHLKR